MVKIINRAKKYSMQFCFHFFIGTIYKPKISKLSDSIRSFDEFLHGSKKSSHFQLGSLPQVVNRPTF